MPFKLIMPPKYLLVEPFKVMGLRPNAFAFSKKACRLYYISEPITRSTVNLQSLRSFKLSSILHKCWKCGAVKINGLFCSQCRVLQKPDDKLNYFQVLGVDEYYNLKDKELTLKFRELQNLLHPDRYTNKDEMEQQVSAEYSALVNKAYTTLLQPLERGLYMLQMKGLQLEEGTVQDDPVFLMKIMELNEELAQAEDPEQVRKLDAANRRITEQLTKEAADAFDKGDLDAAKRALTKMKYYASIGGRIKDLKQKSGIE